MKYLCVPEEYEKNGEKKTSWNRIGVFIEGKNGKQYVKLYHIPGVLIHVYEEKKKESVPTVQASGNFDEFGADMETPF